MRRSVLLAAVLLAVLAPVADAARGDKLKLGVERSACASGALDEDRFAEFTATMPARAGTERMAMRFSLFERGGGGWIRLRDVPGFDGWERSERRRSGFVFTKRVEALEVGKRYMVRVRFRWNDHDGDVQRRATRRSPSCLID
ncbi:MAG TPA: hypothetical protein VGV40_11380 [Solirubrobacteraceae bacterium]|nr:hypothetical protein [Solirubrobacteraceae bacterium]